MAIVRSITADISAPQGFRVSGDFQIHGNGGFGSGTVQLERRQVDNTAFKPVIGATYTSAFDDNITAYANEVYRLSMSGSTTPTVTVEITNSYDQA